VSGAPREVSGLVTRFERNLADYKAPTYNETQVRREFIDPLFKALGWDVDNEQGYAEAYKDVIHEDAIKVGGATKAPDYCFRIGGVRKFFLEAKKPAVPLKDQPEPAFQLRRYAWSARLPLSILTDFEELAVYDCRIRPHKNDKPSTARTMYFTYDQYLDRWDELASVFSREEVLKGSFDRYAESTRRKRGTAEVDVEFLREIERWREVLAANFALRNRNLCVRDLNFGVQRTIDRIIFLRMCEDRGIEQYGQLLGLCGGPTIYPRLGQVFRRADERYNSSLFYFTPEAGREPPDELTLGLDLDDKPLKEILRSLYYPESPYEFSVLAPEILGQVYEQFLGKVIRLTKAHRAKVEEKPEVRKAGGVYYTPTYIVDYIVKHTVGKLLEGKTPASVGPDPKPSPKRKRGGGTVKRKLGRGRDAPLRVLDPACGSGSFLLGAYQYLLDWHRDWYVEDGPANHRDRIYEGAGGQWRLTIGEKKRILLNNIYGVDIDPAAVEVTKLSLLLKVLEGESAETIGQTLRLFHERALPDLADNIKCGNSLIGPDFYDNQQLTLLDEEERYRINAFDWQAEFAEVFPNPSRQGGARPPTGVGGSDPSALRADGTHPNNGFDAVIGNPPYVNAWELFAAAPEIRNYINQSSVFATAERHWDLYVLFLERSVHLGNVGAQIALIIPFSYAIQKYARASRTMVLGSATLQSVADLRTVRVFGRVPVITIIPVICKSPPAPDHRVEIFRPGADATRTHAGSISLSHRIAQTRFLEQNEQMLRLDLSDQAYELCERVKAHSIVVGDICVVNYGAQMSSREKGRFGKDFVLRASRSSSTCKPTVSGRNLYRYSVQWAGVYVEWALAAEMYGARDPAFFEAPKLMIRDITGTHRLELTADSSKLYCDHTILCAQRGAEALCWKDLPKNMVGVSERYPLTLLLGLLASRLVSAFYYLTLTGEGVRTGGGFHTYPKTIRQLPLFDVARANKRHRRDLAQIGALAQQMLDLHKQLAAAKTPTDKTAIQRQIDATDRQIDRLVYELYGLTDEEIRIVEEATGE